jgi:hypothetical protein
MFYNKYLKIFLSLMKILKFDVIYFAVCYQINTNTTTTNKITHIKYAHRYNELGSNEK